MVASDCHSAERHCGSRNGSGAAQAHCRPGPVGWPLSGFKLASKWLQIPQAPGPDRAAASTRSRRLQARRAQPSAAGRTGMIQKRGLEVRIVISGPLSLRSQISADAAAQRWKISCNTAQRLFPAIVVRYSCLLDTQRGILCFMPGTKHFPTFLHGQWGQTCSRNGFETTPKFSEHPADANQRRLQGWAEKAWYSWFKQYAIYRYHSAG